MMERSIEYLVLFRLTIIQFGIDRKQVSNEAGRDCGTAAGPPGRDQIEGVRSLAIFGSATRDEITARSDVDILIEFEGRATFDAYMEAKFFLEDLLNHPVDLVTREAIKPRIQSQIEKEAIYVA